MPISQCVAPLRCFLFGGWEWWFLFVFEFWREGTKFCVFYTICFSIMTNPLCLCLVHLVCIFSGRAAWRELVLNVPCTIKMLTHLSVYYFACVDIYLFYLVSKWATCATNRWFGSYLRPQDWCLNPIWTCSINAALYCSAQVHNKGHSSSSC